MEANRAQPDLLIPVLIPGKKQLIMREDARLLHVRGEDRPNLCPETTAKAHLADRRLLSLKALGPLEPIDGVQGYALYHEIGLPTPNLPGNIDPDHRLSLFSIDRLMAEKHWPYEMDLLFIQQAVSMLRKHLR